MLLGCFQINSDNFKNWEFNLLLEDSQADTAEIQADTAEDIESDTAEDTGAESPSLGIEVSEIPVGIFRMGCTEAVEDFPEDTDCFERESPTHTVEITKPFVLMRTEVTQGLYESIMAENQSSFAYGDDFPVEMVSWFDAVRFANALSRIEEREECYSIVEEETGTAVTWLGFDCKGWRLPTEAEWEYAARGNENFIYAGADNLDDIAWYGNNSENQTQKVGQKDPNAFGLYDMNGNVWEWVWDWYADYTSEDQSDPIGPSAGDNRIYRGGGWFFDASYVRVSNRFSNEPSFTGYNIGIRLARSL